MQITSETKAVLKTEGVGRVIGFVKSNEPGKISIAVPNDRAVMTPAQARQLAAWLTEEADKVIPRETPDERAKRMYDRTEAMRRDALRNAMGPTRFTRGY